MVTPAEPSLARQAAATSDLLPAAELRAGLRVASAASGLLMLLDQHRLTGRLPRDVEAQAARLRHAVKVAIQTANPRPADLATPARSDAGELLRAWIAAQPWAQPDAGPLGWVYLLCFRDPSTGEHRPLQGNGIRGQYAGHYWSWTTDLVRRIEREHSNPSWHGPGRVVQVALARGSTFELAFLEYPATRGRERRLKAQGGACRRCRLCRGTGGPLDARAAVAAVAVAAQVGGRR
jgi:hypothetical protein